jgi:uncharacterized DUF497 family protein
MQVLHSNKALSNLEKHGITFEEAAEAFFDPFYQMGDATQNKIANNEERDFICLLTHHSLPWILLNKPHHKKGSEF